METSIENYYEYINEESIESHLICTICHKPFIQPVLTPCDNIFCRKCVEKSLDDHYLRCSSCTESHLKKHLIPVDDPSILVALDRIQVKCKLCDQTNIERSLFQNHIYQICPKTIITCSIDENDCPWIGLREEYQSHLTTCSYNSLTLDSEKSIDCNKSIQSEEKHGVFLPFSNINLQQRRLQNRDIAIAVKALLINKRCICFDLFHKGISSESASMIASVLHNDTVLETLGLRNNLICDSGVQFLAHALSMNSYLKRLDLNENSITDIGVRLLADMLKTNTSLIKITLSYNRISNEGMDMLVDVLINDNSTLQWLCLAGNSAIDDLSTHSITNLIRHKQALTTLNLENCQLSWWSKKQIYFHQTIHFRSTLEILL